MYNQPLSTFSCVRSWLIRLRAASEQIWQINHKKWLNVERSMVILIPVVSDVTICMCDLSYRYGTTSVGSRQTWSADEKAAAN